LPYGIPRKRLSLPLWLTVKETAELLRTDEKTIYRRCKAGKLPVSPHGLPWRISRDGLFEMAREQVMKKKKEREKAV